MSLLYKFAEFLLTHKKKNIFLLTFYIFICVWHASTWKYSYRENAYTPSFIVLDVK